MFLPIVREVIKYRWVEKEEKFGMGGVDSTGLVIVSRRAHASIIMRFALGAFSLFSVPYCA